jgi:hypothetical protein
MNEAAKSFYNYVLRPQETEGDRPQVVAERGRKFPCIENDADECLFFCQILLEPSHMAPVNKYCPGRVSSSTAFLIAESRDGMRCTSSIPVDTFRRLIIHVAIFIFYIPLFYNFYCRDFICSLRKIRIHLPINCSDDKRDGRKTAF